VNNRDLLFLLISRRSRHRVGTRYFSRGIDIRGNTANFNETEQIVLFDPLPENGEPLRRGRVDGRERLSFVQVRGSVPLFWAEVNNLRYKPDLQIMDMPETVSRTKCLPRASPRSKADSQASAIRAHLQQLVDIYDKVTLVNLVNHKGHELPVKEAFERNMMQVAEVDPQLAMRASYLYFDFHTECRKMRFDRISLLIDRLAPSLDEAKWFHSVTPADSNVGVPGGEMKVLSRQTGVIRSNCMDCLDRTNVSQSALGKWALNKQLQEVGVLSVKETIEDHPEFMSIFRHGASTTIFLRLGAR
jgi:hypothetical protein